MANGFIDGEADVLALLDGWLAGAGEERWDRFYEDRAKPCPFFVDRPDESLAEWCAAGHVPPGRALDLGCGPGRNAVFLAQQGYAVDGVDLSATALAWAAERAAAAGVAVRWHAQSVFDFAAAPGGYALVVDSGCFHHLAPHRRHGYVNLVAAALQPGGVLAMTCFRPEGGSGLGDLEVYERRTLGGGLGYTEERLRALWGRALDIEVLRPMRAPADGSGDFGADFLWAMRARRRPAELKRA